MSHSRDEEERSVPAAPSDAEVEALIARVTSRANWGGPLADRQLHAEAAAALRSLLAQRKGAQDERAFPLQADPKPARPGPLRIPWVIAEEAYSAYVQSFGKSQSLERLAERGGFGWNEMDELLPGWRERVAQRARSSVLEKLGEETLVVLGEWIPDLPDYTAENASPSQCLAALHERARVCALRYADIQRAARSLSLLPRAQEEEAGS